MKKLFSIKNARILFLVGYNEIKTDIVNYRLLTKYVVLNIMSTNAIAT